MRIKTIFIEKIVFPLGDLLLGTQISRQLQIQRRYNTLSEKELNELQRQKLHQILTHGTATCEAYKVYNAEATNDPIDWLKKFPIINKLNLTLHTNRFISEKYAVKKLIKYETSGSSGIRSVVFVDKKE
ncbi:MAG: hypothetical protein ABIS01_11360, partial [Ferruginibacter sp.]